MVLMPHLPILIGKGRRSQMRAHLLEDTPPLPEDSEFSRALAEILADS